MFYLTFLLWVIPCLLFCGLFAFENWDPFETTDSDFGTGTGSSKTELSLSAIYPASKAFVISNENTTKWSNYFKVLVESEDGEVTIIKHDVLTNQYLIRHLAEQYRTHRKGFIVGGEFQNPKR